eukprot:Sspe_Gene.33912::Locus_16500_Transcript_1_1_Confidence_1.000_Length_2248::g.33912::m.33912/K02365/ESP1; separase
MRHQIAGTALQRRIEPLSFGGATSDWFRQLDTFEDTEPQIVIQNIQRQLPWGMAVVMLSESSDGHLVIGRVETDQEPLVVALSDRRDQLDECHTELSAILAAAKEHLSQVNRDKVDETQYRKEWWAKRMEFDERMKSLLSRIGDEVLGAWRSLLLGAPVDIEVSKKVDEAVDMAVEQLREIVGKVHGESAATNADRSIDRRMLRLLISAAPHLYDGVRQDAVRKRRSGSTGLRLLWRDTTSLIFEGLLDVLGVENVDKVDKDVEEQIRRLARELHEKAAALMPLEEPCRRQHVLLVTGNYNSLPWENTSALEGEPASRVPSLSYLRTQLGKYAADHPGSMVRDGMNPNDVYYVLNPDGNLEKTEAKFSWFESQNGWTGCRGPLPGTVQNSRGVGAQAPSTSEGEREWRKQWLKLFSGGLREHDLFIYIGHGTGEQFVMAQDIRSIPHRWQREGPGRESTGGTVSSALRLMTATPVPLSPASPSRAPTTPVLTPRNSQRNLLSDFDSPDIKVATGKKKRRGRCPQPVTPRSEQKTPARHSFGRAKPSGRGDESAVCFLMGCSSGELASKGGRHVDADGTPYAYLVAGCPTVVANLWDVTDGEIDRFTDALLRTWLLEKNRSSSPNEVCQNTKGTLQSMSLCDALNACRDKVKLRYLIGACPIVYGLPMYVKGVVPAP